MAATLALLLAMFIVLPSGAEMGVHDLVVVEWDTCTSGEKLPPILTNRTLIPSGLFMKEVGTSRYLAVVREPFLTRFNFSDVVEVNPVEDVNDVMKKLEISVPPSKDISNKTLTLIKYIPSLKGQTLKQYDSELKRVGKCLNTALKDYPKRVYISSGFPPKYYYFLEIPLELIEFSFSAALDVFGGPGSTKNKISFVQILRLEN
uniref:Major perivitellin subunit 5 n=1 Tax=Pomacea scalaris TaxID=527798 RepID=A0A2U8SZI0_9CAEN|nr:major perivitellin subunit 5 [Pomacea scalaris]